jgi:hypothetical protein
LLLVLVGVWGCASDPDLVYVDLSDAELRQSGPPVTGFRFDVDSYTIVQELPGIEPTNVFFGSAQERAVEALRVYRQTQQDAAEAVLERLRKAYLNEVELSVRTETTQADKEHSARLDKAVEEIHAVFLRHAAAVEPLRYELTQLVGFPDPDPRSLKVPLEENQEAYKRFLRARTLREQIIALDEEYRTEVARRMAAVRAVRDQRYAEIEADAGAKRSDALARARQEADRVSNDAMAALEPTALDPSAQLSAVPGATASVQSGPVSVATQPSQSAVLRETEQDLEDQLEVFLKTYRYRRTPDKSLGRDVTEEFLVWRRKFTDGR